MRSLEQCMNKKRAEGLSINMIIIAALGLIVLIIVAVIFRTQIFHYSKGYTDTANKAIESAEGQRCTSLFSMGTRKCSSTPPGTEWKKIDPAKDKWIDCENTCWEKT